MYAQVGDFRISRESPTVPVIRILRNAGFFKSQNPRKAGTLCTLNDRLSHQFQSKDMKTFLQGIQLIKQHLIYKLSTLEAKKCRVLSLSVA